MTKSDIVTAIYEKTGVDKKAVAVIVDEWMEVIKVTMAEGENVYFRGFGTFAVKARKAKIGRLIQEGKALPIPEHKKPSFKPCKEFKEAVK